MSLFRPIVIAFGAIAVSSTAALAAPVNWADWTGSTPTGAVGSFTTTGGPDDITYTGEVAFLQTGTGTDYFSPTAPYLSPWSTMRPRRRK